MDLKAAQLAPFETWHKGRKCYVVWMYQFNKDSLQDLCQHFQSKLSNLIKLHPVQKPHLTIAPAGFLTEHALEEDEVNLTSLLNYSDKLQRLKLAPPLIRLEKIQSFPHCPYIACRDLTKTSEITKAILDPNAKNFTPHITLGTYLETPLHGILNDFFKIPIPKLTLQASSLDCVRFSTHPINNIPVCPEDFETIAQVHFS